MSIELPSVICDHRLPPDVVLFTPADRTDEIMQAFVDDAPLPVELARACLTITVMSG